MIHGVSMQLLSRSLTHSLARSLAHFPCSPVYLSHSVVFHFFLSVCNLPLSLALSIALFQCFFTHWISCAHVHGQAFMNVHNIFIISYDFAFTTIWSTQKNNGMWAIIIKVYDLKEEEEKPREGKKEKPHQKMWINQWPRQRFYCRSKTVHAHSVRARKRDGVTHYNSNLCGADIYVYSCVCL